MEPVFLWTHILESYELFVDGQNDFDLLNRSVSTS
jgi:hypothetical protein